MANYDSSLGRDYLEQIVARSSEGILLVDLHDEQRPIVYVNPATERLTGYRAGELVGKPWHLLSRGRGEHRGIDELQAAMARAEPIDVELPDQRKDGTVWISRIATSLLRDARGDARYMLIQQRESPRRAGGEAGTFRPDIGRAKPVGDPGSRIDPATGLPRYDQFAAILNRDIAIARRDRRPVCVMLFRILELDVYRQTFGVKAADSCVRMIGAQLSSTLRRAGDLCARYDDTTLVAAVIGQDMSEASRLAERIVANVRGLRLHNPRAKSGRYVVVESALSGGVPQPDDDADTLLERTRGRFGAWNSFFKDADDDVPAEEAAATG